MIINLTQHPATTEQVVAGVVEPDDKALIQEWLTFDQLPSADDIVSSASVLADAALKSGCKKAMIGGAPFLMSALEHALQCVGITPFYAFSVRDSVEEPDGTGGVRKTNVFRHVGFVAGIGQ